MLVLNNLHAALVEKRIVLTIHNNVDYRVMGNCVENGQKAIELCVTGVGNIHNVRCSVELNSHRLPAQRQRKMMPMEWELIAIVVAVLQRGLRGAAPILQLAVRRRIQSDLVL